MATGNAVVRFDAVTFHYQPAKPLLEEASFSVREHAKVTIMGQNGAGKSTMFKLLLKELSPIEGAVNISTGKTVAIAHQVMSREHLDKTIEAYLAMAVPEKPYNLPKLIGDVLDVVHLDIPTTRKIQECSGGQQARLLLAYALIQAPDILLLDEPTNNLDAAGIEHLTQFLIAYPKTCIVISHDENFLNAFTDGILYVDSYTHKVEQYVGNYYEALAAIEAQIERERAKNAQLKKSIQDRKDKINFFAHKGGKMRKLASKLRDQVEEAEEDMVDERKEDRTINTFIIPAQEGLVGAAVEISSIEILVDHKPVMKTFPTPVMVHKKQKLLIKGPNGIGKSTFLAALADGSAAGAAIAPEVRVGYYRQDFSGLDFGKTAYEALADAMESPWNETIYATAGQFLLSAETLKSKVGSLSEGQKGLLCYARFVLQKPGLLIMDEPTNHINFRHLPVIAAALDAFAGAVILISHAPEFLDLMTIDQTIDFGTL